MKPNQDKKEFIINPDNSELIKEILFKWKEVLSKYSTLPKVDRRHFDFQTEIKRKENINDKVDQFLKNPDANVKDFKEFWGKLHSAGQRGRASRVISKNKDDDGNFNVEKIKKTLQSMKKKTFQRKWRKEINGAIRTLWELYGVLQEKMPIINGCSIHALDYLRESSVPRNSYIDLKSEIDRFKSFYEKTVGHITDGTEVEVPLYDELDKFFNVIDKVTIDDYKDVKDEDVKKLYELVLELKGESIGKRPDYKEKKQYWIFQANPDQYEFEKALKKLEKGTFNVRQYDDQIRKNDIVLFWISKEQAIVGYGKVLSKPKEMKPCQKDIKYIKDEELKRKEKRVWVSYRSITPKIQKSEFKKALKSNGINPENVSIIRNPRGTNFPIDEEVWKCIFHNFIINYWSGAPQPLENEEDFKGNPKNSMFEKMMLEDYYALGWKEFQKPLSEYSNDDIKEIRGDPPVYKSLINMKSMKKGDIIISRKTETPTKDDQKHRIYGIGVVTSNYIFDKYFDTTGVHDFHHRKVKWFVNFSKNKILGKHYIELDYDFTDKEGLGTITLRKKGFNFYNEVKEGLIKTLEKVGVREELIDKIKDNLKGLEEKAREIKSDLAKKSVPRDDILDGKEIFDIKELNIEDLYFPEEQKKQIQRRIINALKAGKSIILIGPPGTGKSKLAKSICSNCWEGKYSMSTATSDWSTFETIGGYQPSSEEANKLEFVPGIFLKCFKNQNGNRQNKWLIIDEINRADIDKAFGALFSALAGDNIELPYHKNGKSYRIIGDQKETENLKGNNYIDYIIPENWRIIATMNTYDKASLYEMSYAFMRRFAFIPVGIPEFEKNETELIEKYMNVWEDDDYEFQINDVDEILENIVKVWRIINESRKIGPALIEDICKYINEFYISNGNWEKRNWVSPIIMYVLPQFEGLMDNDLESFYNDLTVKMKGIDKGNELKNYMESFFDIEL